MLFVIDKAAFNKEFNLRGGMISEYLTSRGRLLQKLAKVQVGKDTGKLMSSIKYDVTKTSTGLVVTVGSGNKIALWHHQGTKPHIILPKTAKTLRFNSHGKIIYAKVVHHPGTKPNHYLTDNLRKVI